MFKGLLAALQSTVFQLSYAPLKFQLCLRLLMFILLFSNCWIKLAFSDMIYKNMCACGRHSFVNPSVTTILRPLVRIPSSPSMLYNLKLNCDVKRTKINKKRLGWPIFLKKLCALWGVEPRDARWKGKQTQWSMRTGLPSFENLILYTQMITKEGGC